MNSNRKYDALIELKMMITLIMNMNYIRERILETLKEQKMTQRELAERSQVPYVSLNRFLASDKNSIGIESLLKIANGLNMPIDFLLSQRNTEASALAENVLFKISRLPEEDQKQYLLSMSTVLDIMLKNVEK
jgi:transcriptional regulator with XRE-family HTH domain